jgi:NAD(P)-dependent dehydrogenase (short-subunit alcohol dehydrogenase family)
MTSRVCVVTGAAAGLGLAISEAFAADGDHVVMVDRDAIRGQDEAVRLDGGRARVEFEHVDVSKEDQVVGLADRLRERHGRVDVLVNNAGTAMREGDVVELDRKQWDLTIAVNLTSVYLVSHHLVPMVPSGGSIVNVATAGVLRAVPGSDAYIAAKGGVVAISRAMAVSLAGRGIRVNVICPGAVETVVVAGRAGEPRVQAMRSRLSPPLRGHLGRPEEVSSVVRFLCSEGAAYVNGAVVPIEGGSVT